MSEPLSEQAPWVLLVEDDHDVREVLADVLLDQGYRTVGASNGAEGLERLRSSSELPCVILLDIMMPVMDGFEFRAQQLSDERLKDTPVIVFTAHAAGLDAVHEMGAVAALPKPVQLETLLATIERVCGR